MKLNELIIRSELSKHFRTGISGPVTNALHLKRPVFYREDDEDFEKDCLYLATVEHLPKRPRIHPAAVLVCIGDGLTLNYYRERMCLILIRDRADFFGVFQILQEVFDRYDAWEQSLYSGLADGSGAAQLIRDSREILGHPLYLLDHSFRFIASEDGALENGWGKSQGSLSVDSLGAFLSASDLMMEKKNAICLDLPGKQVLCVNLFDSADRYRGCLCVDRSDSPAREGEELLAEFLAGFLTRAVEKIPVLQESGQAGLRKVLKALVGEQPLSRSQKVLLKSYNNTVPYICIVLRNAQKRQQLPLGYICESFENEFTLSQAFIREDEIVVFLGTGDKGADYRPSVSRSVRSFCAKMRLAAGISNEFLNLYDTRIHYLQAQSALEDGLLLSPDDTLFYFSSYALTEMVINSLGGLPVEAYYPEGLKAVLKHDESSPVSYLETLRVLLEENLSYTAAAQRLFIHRSTLLDRMERIEKEMHIDLKNSEQRLQLEILLRAIDLESVMRRI